VGHFALLDPDFEYGSGSTDQIESGSNWDPDPQPWFSLPGVCVEILLSGVVAARVLGTVGTLSARRSNNRYKKDQIYFFYPGVVLSFMILSSVQYGSGPYTLSVQYNAPTRDKIINIAHNTYNYF
jgi:hypothetical protein